MIFSENRFPLFRIMLQRRPCFPASTIGALTPPAARAPPIRFSRTTIADD
jgi:hypothetical protein